MRRRTSAVILAVMILLNGCQKSVDETQTSTVEERKDILAENSEEISTEKNTEESITSDENLSENTRNSLPQISITMDFINWFTEDNSTCLFRQTYCTVEVTDDGFDNLAEELRNWTKEHIIPDADIESELQSAEERLESAEDPTDFFSYYTYQGVQIGRSDAHILSLIENVTEDYTTNGTYFNYGIRGYTFDVQSGKRLALEDLLIDKEDFYAKATDYMAGEIYEYYSEYLHPYYKQSITDILTYDSVNYYLDASGIVIIYIPWDIGGYALREECTTFPYSIFGKYLKPEYRLPQGAAIASVPDNENIAFFTQAKSPVRIENSPSGTCIVSGTHVDDRVKGWIFEEAHFIRRTDGKSFLVINTSGHEFYTVFVYDITGGGLKICDELKGMGNIRTQVNLDTITLYKNFDILGTYTGQMFCTIESDGTLMQTEDVFSILHPRLEMTVTKELPVTIDDKKTTLPAGSTLKITAANNADTVYFVSSDGKEGYINYTLQENDQVHYIDGISEFEYFDAIPYNK